MSQRLGISRAGVWKAIEGLRQEGYIAAVVPAVNHGKAAAGLFIPERKEVVSQQVHLQNGLVSGQNRGYRLEEAPDRLREGELSGSLAGALVALLITIINATQENVNLDSSKLTYIPCPGPFQGQPSGKAAAAGCL